MKKINLEEKFGLFSDQWSPRVIAELNDYHVKIARIQGDFTWHTHDDTDEMFVVVEGSLRMDYENGAVFVESGELVIVPKGTAHKPYAEEEAKIMLIEPGGTSNTGGKKDSFTREQIEWI
ncbi:MAG: cupin domain-containing protein [Spirochaetia bacterium]